MIDVICDANVALKWFHSEGEEEVDASRELLSAHLAQIIAMMVLDLTAYEVGNALLRGGPRASSEQVTTVLQALGDVCPVVSPDRAQMALATALADRHQLTLYHAAYAAVAQSKRAVLVTLDRQLLGAGFGQRPSQLVAQLTLEP